MCDSKKALTWAGKLGCLILLAAGLAGCSSVKITEPPRTATEQLLLSTAADRALRSADLSMFDGKKVYLDGTYFDSYDPKYVLGTIRDALSRAGAILVPAAANSDVILEARSGALSTDSSSSLIGLPSFGIPIPLTGAIQTPEIAFYKSQKQFSTAKIALLAFANPSGRHLYSSGPLVGKSYNNFNSLFGFDLSRTDLPEKQKSVPKAEQYQSWQPVYTPQNFAIAKPTMVEAPTNTVTTNSAAATPPTNSATTNNPAQ